MMGTGVQLNRRWVVARCVQFRLCSYLFCFVLVLQYAVLGKNGDAMWRSDQSRVLKNLEAYEITYPQWLNPARDKRSQGNTKYPSEAEITISAGGAELVLQLQRNQELLAPGYQEIWYSPSGARQFSRPSSREHCYYHGAVRGVEGSSVVLSTCAGLRGMIAMNHSVTYMIEPLANHAASQGHAVFRAESLKITPGTCGHHHHVQNHTDKLQDLIGGIAQTNRGRRDVSRSTKYVELMVVADHAEFVKHGRDLEKTRMKLLEAANYVDKYYKALNIRVALIWLEIWNEQNKISVTDNPYSTLKDFLTWRRKQLLHLPNDNAQLVTGVSFQGTTIGLAPLKAMCSEYQSGGVNSDHSESAVGVAATMAHEMGHNFGMSHDSESCCQALPEDGGCIMAAATAELKRYLSSGGGKCLFNPPNTKAMYGGQRCGNGYLEEGEECDCGEVEECSSPCCNAHNCTLKAGAECAHGVCCQDCKLKSPGALCRSVSGSCDLPEYCDGKSEACPANFYLVDGSLCSRGAAYCYTGMCLILDQQCSSLWGKDAQPAPDLCFTKVNEAGDSYGNCGKDLMGKYRGCAERDAKCGKIQCLSSASKPIEANAVAIDTTIHEGRRQILCRGTHVYRPDQDEQSQGDTLDPGLVMTGTKCGDNAICFDGECRNVSFLRADECNAKCHGHGLCNNNHNCHCDPGWAPPYCGEQGSGGSLDSGPVVPYSLYPLLVLLPVFLCFGLAVLFLCWCYRKKLHSLKSTVHLPQCIHVNASASPKSRAPANVHANSTLQTKLSGTDQPQERQRSSPSGPARPRHASVRPTVKPPPIPAYALHQQDSVHSDATSKPHPSQPVGAKPRPSPPNRPPPPCPITKCSHIKAEVSQRKGPEISPGLTQKGKSNLLPPAGHTRFQSEISGQS